MYSCHTKDLSLAPSLTALKSKEWRRRDFYWVEGQEKLTPPLWKGNFTPSQIFDLVHLWSGTNKVVNQINQWHYLAFHRA